MVNPTEQLGKLKQVKRGEATCLVLPSRPVAELIRAHISGVPAWTDLGHTVHYSTTVL